MKPECIDGTDHDASRTTVATVVVHLEQMSSGWHVFHEGLLVHGCLGDFGVVSSSGQRAGLIPPETDGTSDTPSFPLEEVIVGQGSEEARRRMTHRRRHWKICRM